uniref:beta-ketoacyl synthase N-terminal-like domain-containing protein n=1 Tax=Acaryochloris sp. IP29b_bin.137 TaxID=2969217 RepID=UPI00344DE5F8
MFSSEKRSALLQLQQDISDLELALIKTVREKHSVRKKNAMSQIPNASQLQQQPIAIIGMASLFPQAKNLQIYWDNIVHQVDCITEVPASRWDTQAYFDPDPKATDKTYCKRGGFIPDVDFDPMAYGIPPNLLEVTDISQLLALSVASQALEDAGYGQSNPFDRSNTGVVLGVAAGRQLAVPFGARLQYPIWERVLKSYGLSDQETQEVVAKIKAAYPEWEENAFPGMLANIVSGRIANRLDLGGVNCTVDAACASSLAAFKIAISELLEGRSNMMLAGGVDVDNSIFAYLCFSKTPALSRNQQVRPFDIDADGMMLGEGLGMMVLKRLEDAEREGDRIYAVIKGIGTSSDGKYKSIYAPSVSGQVKALQRAYKDADIAPSSVGLIEAHGTGTMVGDPTEFAALNEVFDAGGQVALGSVKSQIGHTKAAAGTASLIKATLALHHKVLPPTINVTQPNPRLQIEDSAFYLNTETRPWVRSAHPRRAGVSSFGFGGTNYHIVLEEYESEHHASYRLHRTPQPILLQAATPDQLQRECDRTLKQLCSDAGDRHFADLIETSKSLQITVDASRLGFVAMSRSEAAQKLECAIACLKHQAQDETWEHPTGIFYRRQGLALEGKVVALFSGQGSQYVNMGRELVVNFPELRQTFAAVDELFIQADLEPPSGRVFPAPAFDKGQVQVQAQELQRTEYAQPALGALSVGLYKILQQAGFQPDFVAGHSFGELTALWSADVLTDQDYFALVKARGQAMAKPAEAGADPGTMLAVKGEVDAIQAVVKAFPKVTIANHNSPKQLVLAGIRSDLEPVQATLKEQKFSTVWLPVSAAFHTSLVDYAQKPFAEAVDEIALQAPQRPIYTNVTAAPYPTEIEALRTNLKEHLSHPVQFTKQIENIYKAGGSCFVEFGPRRILTNLVQEILGDRPHLAIALNASRQKDSDHQLR